MKLLFIAFIFIFPSAHADTWRTEDTYRETTFQILHIIDWGQTRYIAKNPDKYYEVECAWIIGKYPSVETVDTYMLVIAAAHPLIAYYLPSNWRSAFQYITIGGKLNNVIGNASIGIKIDF